MLYGIFNRIVKCILCAIGNCDSAHQTHSLPSSASLPEDRDQQWKCNNTDGNNNDTVTKSEEVFEENESDVDIFDDDVLEEAQTEIAVKTKDVSA